MRLWASSTLLRCVMFVAALVVLRAGFSSQVLLPAPGLQVQGLASVLNLNQWRPSVLAGRRRRRLLQAGLEDLGLVLHSPVRATVTRLTPAPPAPPAASKSSKSMTSSDLVYKWAEGDVRTDRYSVLVNTFRGRDALAVRLLDHYAQCALLDRVVLVWNDLGREVPEAVLLAVARHQDSGRVGVVLQRASSNLTNRFRPQPLVRTDVIFSTDEDVQYACELLDYGFGVARAFPDKLVGFAPRLLKRVGGGYKYSWYNAYKEGMYNTVWTTKGAFLRREHHELFFANEEFAQVRAEVDLRVTGEDILMSLMHAFFAGPRKVQAILVPKGAFKAFESSANLFETSSEHRKHIMGMVKERFRRRGKPNEVPNHTKDSWCEPYALPPMCDHNFTFARREFDHKNADPQFHKV